MLSSRMNLASAAILGLALVLIGAVVVGCSEPGASIITVDLAANAPLTTFPAVSPAGELHLSAAVSNGPELMEVDGDTINVSPPCSDESDASCAPRDVSQFNLLSGIPAGARYTSDVNVDSLEDVLEKGLRLGEASPVHIGVRGTAVSSSTRCAWRGVARTSAQREGAIRLWLGLAATDPLPSAAEVERRFMEYLGQLNLELPQTAKTSFRALARGGLTTEYLFLTCYLDYAASEYVLGAGPTTLTVAYDQIVQTRSYDLYRRAHTAGEFGSATLMSESAYEAALYQAVWDAEAALSGIVEGRESVVFLAPMGAHHAIAIEAWQVVAQWDVQTVDGTVNAVRYGAYEGDPEHTQTLANLKTRITTAAADDDFSDDRIANVSGLQAYYTTIGAYEDITPDDGQTTTFTPAQPPPMRPCANGTAVPNPRDNRMLVQDCEVLLALKDTLAGTATLNWSTSTAITSWDGVTTAGTPSRVTQLVLTNKSLTGTIPPELAQLTGLTELKLDNNRLTGCIPLPLRQISNHDLDDLSLSYCGDPPPTPGGLSTSQADGTYTISWDAVTGADLYEVQHRAGTDADWVALPTTASTSATYSPEGGALCGPIEFRVRARGDGITFIPDWSEPTSASEVASIATSGLITDCELLLSIKDTLAGTSTLNWSMEIGIASWNGVTIGGTPSRITQLDLRINRLNGSIPSQIGSLDKLQQLYLGHNQLTGAIPPELGNLTELTQLWLNINQLTGPIPARLGDLTALVGLGLHYNRLTEEIPAELGNLTELEQMFLENNRLVGAIPLQLGGLDLSFISLAGNSLTGCIPVGLRDVRDNDLNTLGLAYCGAPPAPADLSVDLTAEAFSVEWSAVTGAASYEIKYRIAGSEAAWVTRPTTANTSETFTPTGDSPCSGTYEFQVRAQGDGKGYEATWGAAAETTGTCNNVPAFGEESYAFSIAEDAALDAAVGSVSATDDDTGDTLTYAFTDEDTVEKFNISSSTGAITVAVALDYETTPSYTLSVQVSDDNGGTASVEVVITVTNVPEGLPPMPANLSVSLTDTTFSFTWDTVENAAKYRVQFHTGDGNWADAATDITGTSASFSPTDGPACGTTYSFQVLPFGDGVTYIEDWGTASDSESVTTDACNQIPAFTNAPYSFSVFENAEVGYEVGTVTAEDLDTDDTLSFSISEGNEAGKFNISSSTGAITVAVALDYETTPSYTLNVQVSDGNGGISSSSVSILIIPLTCSNGVVVADVADNAGLVGDCQALLDGKQTLAGSAVPSWSARTAIANWDGIVLGGTPKRVTELQLGSRGLSGSIPSTLGSLSNLTKLYLFSNQLSGAIPTQLGSLSNLTHLFLNSNRLTGSIPKEIGEISTLTILSLGSNQLTESIPAELGRLSNLTSLVLNNNSLTGDLPTELGSLSSLQILWLQENQLSGTIPTELGALSNLTQLLLGYNQLTGSIPAELADLNNLESLQLKGNQLSGCIPPALRSVAKNDLNQIGLLNCAPAPQGLSVSLSDGTFSITWNAVTGASQFEVQYRTDSEEDWVSLPATAGTSSTFSPDGGPACGKTFEFQVRSFGDGATYGAAWGVSSDEVSQATSACS